MRWERKSRSSWARTELASSGFGPAVELYHDTNGMGFPPSIAPFEVVITPVNIADETQRTIAARLAATARSDGLDMLFDHRDERAGVKFKDASIESRGELASAKRLRRAWSRSLNARRTDGRVPIEEAVAYVLARVQPARNAA